MQQQSTDIHTMSYRLWRQALSGDSGNALMLLEDMDREEMSVLAADLLARLYVRTGRLVEARTLWKRILDADPNYPPAVRALDKLDSPWLMRAVAKRYSSWFGVGVLLLFALYGLGALLFHDEGASFAVMGVATILAVLGIYLAGLFGRVLMTADLMFAFGQGSSRPRPQPGSGRESQSGRLYTDALRHRR